MHENVVHGFNRIITENTFNIHIQLMSSQRIPCGNGFIQELPHKHESFSWKGDSLELFPLNVMRRDCIGDPILH